MGFYVFGIFGDFIYKITKKCGSNLTHFAEYRMTPAHMWKVKHKWLIIFQQKNRSANQQWCCKCKGKV
jgi:hypothetical protein